MPKGTRHDLTGTLLQKGARLILRMEGGGEWELDTAKSVRHLLGRPVKVSGVRADFNLIDVDKIEPS